MGGSSKRQVVAYKYYEDQHIVLALSNFDFISHLWFADKLAWIGKSSGLSNGYSQITVNQPSLFGGEKREGGVSGVIDVGMGWPNQPKNSYLVSRLGNALMPAYRGVVSLIFRDFYFGNNPYLKALKVRAQSIHKMSDGSTQWYDEKAEIFSNGYSQTVPIVLENFSNGGLYTYRESETQPGVSYLSNFDFDNNVLTVIGPYPSTGHIFRPIGGEVTVTRVTGDFRLNGVTSDDDISTFGLSNSSGQDILSIAPRRQKSVDPQQRTTVNGGYLALGTPVSYEELSDSTWYHFDATIGDNKLNITLTRVSDGVVVGEALDVTYNGAPIASELRFNTEGAAANPSNGSISWRDINVYGGIRTGDINPVHFIRECHTDRVWGGRYPESKMGDSYTSAADTIFDEGLGVSFLFTEEIRWKEIIEEVARHIDAIPYQDPDTGLMEIKLIRDDYDLESLPLLDPSNSDLQRIQEPEDHEIFNQVVIEFWNRETGKNDSVTLSDPAAIDMVGYPNPKTFQYSGICTKKVAMLVAERDLARVSRPFFQGRVKTNRVVANLKPGDVFILNSPDDNISQMVCRVTKRSESGLLNGDITIEFGEDIFGQVYTTFAEPEESIWVDPVGNPLPFSYETAFEVPYYLLVQELGESAVADLNNDACYYGFAGVSPATGAHIDYDLYVYPDGTTQEPDPEFSLTAAFTPHAVVTATVPETATSIPVEPLSAMDSVRVGQLAMVGDAADDSREFIAVDAEVVNGDTSLTVKRGLIDTTPKVIPEGTVLYFVDTFSGFSETEYMPGETVEGYGAPTNGQGSFGGPFTYHDVLMQGRFDKPYPPANLTINSLSFPGPYYSPPTNEIVFDWHHRDRVLQSDQVIDWFEATDYGPEASTTYLFESDAYDSDGALIQAAWLSINVGLVKTYTLDLDSNTPPAGTATLVVNIWTIRAGEASLQPATYTFLMPGTEIMADENTNLPVLDTDGSLIQMETS